MPTWVAGVLQWAVGMALAYVKPEDVKKELASLFEVLDQAIQGVDAKVTGPFKGVADQVALEFHECAVAIVAALRK